MLFYSGQTLLRLSTYVKEVDVKIEEVAGFLRTAQAQLEEDQSSLKKLNAELSRLREEKGLALGQVEDLKKTYEALVKKFQGEISNQEITLALILQILA